MDSSKITYYLSSIRKKGLIETCRQVFSDYYYNKKFAKYNFYFLASNLFLADNPSQDQEVISKAANKDATTDSPTSSYYVFHYFRQLPIAQSKINLLDIGCGSGKVLVAGMFEKFNKVTGIDLGTDSLERARENCKKAEKASSTKHEVISYDATEYAIPDDTNVIFLANPFYDATMKSVVKNIVASYNRNRRPLYIIYHCPLCAALFDEQPIFSRMYEHSLTSGMTNVIIYKTT